MPPVAFAVGAAVVGAVGATASVGVATAIGFATLGVAAAGVAGLTALAMRPKTPPGASGAALSFRADPAAPIPYALGRTAVGGSYVFAQTHGPSTKAAERNKHLTYFTILSGGGPVQEIEAFYANDEQVSFGAGGNAIGRFRDRMRQTQQLGACPSPALTPPATDGPLPEWTAAHGMSGYAAAAWSLELNTKDKTPVLTTTPKPLWVGRWVKVYDPRLDGTYPGGVGACRALDESTYVWSANPFLHALTWCLGRWQNGRRVLGVGAPLNAIDVAAFVEGANVCDANGWTLGGVVTSADSKWDVLSSMLQAGGGWPMRLGAKISCGVQAPRVSLDTVRGGDIVGQASITAVQPRRDRVNRIIPRYRSEAHKWQVVAAGIVAVAAYITADGGERTREVEFGLVQSAKQAAELARYEIENGREIGPIRLPLKPRWRGVKPGDCITVDEPELGLNGQKVLVLRRNTDLASGVVTLDCRSEVDGKHPFALGQVADPPPARALTGVDLLNIPAPAFGVWTATGGVTPGPAPLPMVLVTGASDNPNATGIIVEYREDVPGAPWTLFAEGPPTSTRFEVTTPRGQTSYVAAVSYRTRGGIGERRELTAVTTAGVATVGEGGNIVLNPGGGQPLVILQPGDILTALGEARDVVRVAGLLSAELRRISEEARAYVDDIAVAGLRDVVEQARLRSYTDRLAHDAKGVPLGAVIDQKTSKLTTDLGSEVATRQLLQATTADNFAVHDSRITATTNNLLAEVNTRSTQIAAVNTNLAGHDARISTTATNLQAEVDTRTIQVAAVQNNLAAHDGRITTTANNLSAFASEFRLLGAWNFDRTGFVLDLNKTLVSPTESFATRLSSISSSFGNVNARVDQEITARTSGDSANASSLETLRTDLRGSFASVTAWKASVDGLQAKQGVALDVNGYITGYVQNNDGRSGSFIVLADRFAVGAPGAPTAVPLGGMGGVTRIRSAMIGDASIDTLKIANRATTDFGHLVDNSPVGLSPGVQAQVASFDYPGRGGVKQIFVVVGVQNNSGGRAGATVRILSNGVVINAAPLMLEPGSYQIPNVLAHDTDLWGGVRTISVTLDTGASGITKTTCSIFVVEFIK